MNVRSKWQSIFLNTLYYIQKDELAFQKKNWPFDFLIYIHTSLVNSHNLLKSWPRLKEHIHSACQVVYN